MANVKQLTQMFSNIIKKDNSSTPQPTLVEAKPTAESELRTKLLVAAFDFGTTYSGYAFSFYDDPKKVQANQSWNALSEQLMSLKTSTSVLLDQKNQFSLFGYEAENKYIELAEDNALNDEKGRWRLFRRFKMILHNSKDLTRRSNVYDMQGQPFQALAIFTMAIQYLKNHFLSALNRQVLAVKETDIQYVITVPAIWSDSAKQFMREAAIKAGIDGKRLKLALEPESASICCSEESEKARIALAGIGTRSMVIDLGGGTADISVHERKEDKTLKEIHKASGGPWGGIYVDENYLQWLRSIFGSESIDKLKNEAVGDYMDLLRQFETKKRAHSTTVPIKTTIRLPNSLRTFVEKAWGKDIGNVLSQKGLTLVSGDKVRVKPSIFDSWFDGPLNKVISHVKELLKEDQMKSVQIIMLVGGFGESKYVQERMEKEFAERKLLVPEEAGLVVLKGAVMFGHDPTIVSSRVMKYTYGVAVDQMFNEKKHPLKRMTVVTNTKMLLGGFKAFVSMGDEVKLNKEISDEFTTNSPEMSLIEIYQSTSKLPYYVADADCTKLGDLIVHHPNGPQEKEKKIDVTFIFGETELVVKWRVKDTGKEEFLKIDCLKDFAVLIKPRCIPLVNQEVVCVRMAVGELKMFSKLFQRKDTSDDRPSDAPPKITVKIPHPKPKKENILLVAAFDFGTTYSGFAFSFHNDPMNIQTQNWVAGSEKLISPKTPSCVLLNPKGEFDSFGFFAENKYVDLAEEDKHTEWRFFRRFKMVLHDNKKLSRTTTIEDINGKPFSALKIFAMSIRYLREQLVESVTNQQIGLKENEILFVITVPAIWDDRAKQFMREAALEAGIKDNRLKLALEPEAASLWCIENSENARIAMAGTGTRNMVVDLGGGTADISVHERKENGTVKEVHKASGGPWGGIYVDENYMKWIASIFGQQAVDDMKKYAMGDYFDILREFETKKRAHKTNTATKTTLRVSSILRAYAEKHSGMKLEEMIAKKEFGDTVVLRGGDKLRIESSVMDAWFNEPVDRLIAHLKELLKEERLKSVKNIVLVGGFGESSYVQEKINGEFVDRKLLVPVEAGLVVLKGAVRFGHEPNIVSSRIMKYTYGVAVDRIFNEKKHPKKRMGKVNGEKMVMGCFDAFVKAGDEVEVNAELSKEFPANSQEMSLIEIYQSAKPEPWYVNDSECTKLGDLLISHPGAKQNKRKIDVTFIFGETELVVKWRIHETGNEEFLKINCLH
ncbi:uncharacterized protein LOC128230890 [Mya arenaria]|uniref:uncharacterized protein LOC128230890 n=1 Tax=Mya arenaria TaxID=6604 RepID=UPI0022E4CAA6|nr:uncharacterized protein LOC128230890 [Mya arenaria]